MEERDEEGEELTGVAQGALKEEGEAGEENSCVPHPSRLRLVARVEN